MEVKRKEELNTRSSTISVGIELTWEPDLSFVTGPVADLAKEIPFELLNSTQVRRFTCPSVSFELVMMYQNRMAPHGDGVYWKGVTHNGPALEPITQAHEKAVEIVKNGNFLATLLYEWISLEKINSVPVNKTAYRRLSVPNCLVSISWPGNTHSADKVDEARSLTRQLAARVAGGELSSKNQGYANYGVFSFSFLIHRIKSLILEWIFRSRGRPRRQGRGQESGSSCVWR